MTILLYLNYSDYLLAPANHACCPSSFGARHKPNQRKRRLAARRRGF